jgi:hypothetical protein
MFSLFILSERKWLSWKQLYFYFLSDPLIFPQIILSYKFVYVVHTCKRRDFFVIQFFWRSCFCFLYPAAGSKYAVIGGHLHVSDVTLEDTLMSYRCYARHRLNLAQKSVTNYSSPPAKIIFTHQQQINTQQQQQQQQQQLPMSPQLVPYVDGLHPSATTSTSLRIRHVRLGQDDIYMTCTVLAYPPAKIR